MDPFHSIGRFYDGLVKVKGYGSMPITEAAQRVQRSAHPGAYAKHEDYARALASALRGYSPASFTCQVDERGGGRALGVADDLSKAFGEVSVNLEKNTLTVPLSGKAADVRARGWMFAHYLVGNAARLRITEISFDGKRWTAADSPDGWVTDGGANRSVVTVDAS
jgi:hypothetical protein